MSLRSAVFFFSWDGNTAHLARAISTTLSIPMVRLEPEKVQDPEDYVEYVWEDQQITYPRLPVLRPINVNPPDSDLVFLGSPIWKGNVAPPVRSFLEGFEFSRRRFALFCSYSGRIGGYFRQLSNLLVGNEIIGTIGFREPLTLGKEKSEREVAAWAKEMYEKAEG
ncbi:MAG: flavodoxin family protein [Spirochaetaceae bacterium]